MRIQEIELSIGESVVFGDHVLTILDVESARALMRVDPLDAETTSASATPAEQLEALDASRFAAVSLAPVPR